MSDNDSVLNVIKTRRVIRNMTNQEIDREQLQVILEAGRWAPAAGNQRTNRFVVIQDPTTLKLIRNFSPGMYQQPSAIILVCVDLDIVKANKTPETDLTPLIDIGATMQTMMLAAHGIGLGSGPVTSFSKEAVRVILNLPSNLNPEMLLCIGYPAPKSESQLIMRPKVRITWQSLTHWERYLD